MAFLSPGIRKKKERKKKRLKRITIFLLGGVYRSPNNTVENNAMLWTTLKKVAERYKKKLLIVGDFNCKYIDWKTGTTNIEQETNPNNCLLKTCRDCYLKQIVDLI